MGFGAHKLICFLPIQPYLMSVTDDANSALYWFEWMYLFALTMAQMLGWVSVYILEASGTA